MNLADEILDLVGACLHYLERDRPAICAGLKLRAKLLAERGAELKRQRDALLVACQAVAAAASEIILLADRSTNAGSARAGVAVTLKKLVLDAIAQAEGR